MSGPGDPYTADAAQVTQIRPRGLPAQEVAPSPCQHRPREPSALHGPRPTGTPRCLQGPGVTQKKLTRTQYEWEGKLPGSPGPRVATFPPGVLSGAPPRAPRNIRRVCLLQDPSVSGGWAPGPAGGGSQAVLTRLLPQLQLLRDAVPPAPVPAGLLLASACRTLGPRGRRDDGGGDPGAEPQWGRLKEGNNVSRPLPAPPRGERSPPSGPRTGRRRRTTWTWARSSGRTAATTAAVVDVRPAPASGATPAACSSCFRQEPRAAAQPPQRAVRRAVPGASARAGGRQACWRPWACRPYGHALPGPGGATPTGRCTRPCAEFVNASTTYELGTVHNLFRKLTPASSAGTWCTLRSVSDLYVQKQLRSWTTSRPRSEYYFPQRSGRPTSPIRPSSPTVPTRGRLTKGLLPRRAAGRGPMTQMLLLNCLYFKGRRQHGPGLDSRAGQRACSLHLHYPCRARLRVACRVRKAPARKPVVHAPAAAATGCCCQRLRLTTAGEGCSASSRPCQT